MCRARSGLILVLLAAFVFVGSVVDSVQAQPAVCPTDPFPICVYGPGEEVCLELPFVGADSVKVGLAISTQNQFCFTATHSGRWDFAAVAYYGNESLACQLHVDVSFGLPPQVTCPEQPFEVHTCQPGPVCLSVPTSRASTVQTSAGEYSADNFCLQVDTSGVYNITLVAANACGVDSCSFQVLVTVGDEPVISCPAAMSVEQCHLEQICIPVVITGADSVTTSAGTWAEGTLCLTPEQFGEFSVEIRAYNECTFAVCNLPVVVTPKPATVLTCPQETVSFVECGPNMVCVPITYEADSVRFSTGNYADGQLCFQVGESSIIPVTVTAWGPCGTVPCEFTLDVTILTAPTLICPTDTLLVQPCVGREVCFPLGFEAQNADSVRVEGGNWSPGMLCFTPAQPGLDSFTIRAYNRCGVTTCERFVEVAPFQGPATIECPSEPFAVSQCPLGDVSVPLVIANADYTFIDGASWADNILTFTATREGAFNFVVEAYGDCGADTCEVSVIVSRSQGVVRAPELNLVGTRDPDGICCVEVPMPEGYVVSVGGGTWANDTLCFVVDALGVYQFTVIGENECQRYMQPVSVTIDMGCGPNFICYPGDAESWFSCKFPDTVRLRYTIDDAYQVDVPGGWYDRDEDLLNFEVDSAGLYVWSFAVSNECDTVDCGVAAWVELDPAPTACFTATADVQEPLTVHFGNCSPDQGYFTWQWVFGDGSSTYSDYGVTHTYPTAGCYEVMVIEYGACGTDTMTDTICLAGNQIVQPTPFWLSLYCSQPSLDGVPLQIGDVIEVYDNSGVLCALDTVAPHGFGFTAAYADDPGSLIDEGADAGTPLSFKVNGQSVYVNPPVTWTAMGDRIPVCTFTTANCVRIPIHANWNLISWDVAYSGPIEDALAPLTGCIEVVLGWDGKGLSWDPILTQYSTLDQVDYHAAYWIKALCDTALTICAPPINPDDYIPLTPGWNLVSFWRDGATPDPTVETGFASILENLDLAYTFANGYQIWKPGQGGGLNYLAPLQGYWLKMSVGDNLAYPGFGSGPMDPPPQSSGSGVAVSTQWMSAYGSNQSSGLRNVQNNLVEFRSAKWVVCGRGQFRNGRLDFTSIYGFDPDDPATQDYPRAGELVGVEIIGLGSGGFLWEGLGGRIFLNSLDIVTSAEDVDLRPSDFTLNQNYPNPFNPSTTIAFCLHTSGPAKLELFNIRGELVRTLIDRPIGSGEHTIVWDGADNDGRPVAGGVYLYRLTAGGRTESRKMVLIK